MELNEKYRCDDGGIVLKFLFHCGHGILFSARSVRMLQNLTGSESKVIF